jgi:hypothetical protein
MALAGQQKQGCGESCKDAGAEPLGCEAPGNSKAGEAKNWSFILW